MVFVAVDDGEDLEGGFLEHVFHGFADFGAFCCLLVYLRIISASPPLDCSAG